MGLQHYTQDMSKLPLKTNINVLFKRKYTHPTLICRGTDGRTDGRTDARTDGETMKLLGYKWDPEKDELSPGLGELNLNKKLRGERKPNPEPVKTRVDAEKLLNGVQLTRSLIVGKISELFDPCGFFEPIKLQMKLQTSSLKGKDWDEVLPGEDQETIGNS